MLKISHRILSRLKMGFKVTFNSLNSINNQVEKFMSTIPTHIEDPIWRSMKETGRLDGRPVSFYQQTTSTNDIALELGRQGAPAGTLVVADSQTGGRGRLQRQWFSPPGTGLYVSIILRPPLEPSELPKITLTAGVAVCAAIEEVTGLQPQIKWPNDILIDGKKTGGILTESGAYQHGAEQLVVVGIGLNVLTPATAFPGELQHKVTSLAVHADKPPARGLILQTIVRHFEQQMALLIHDSFAEILAALRKRDATAGKTLSWLTTDGNVVTGRSVGIDEQGLLHIRDNDSRIHTVLSGDINLNRQQ